MLANPRTPEARQTWRLLEGEYHPAAESREKQTASTASQVPLQWELGIISQWLLLFGGSHSLLHFDMTLFSVTFHLV